MVKYAVLKSTTIEIMITLLKELVVLSSECGEKNHGHARVYMLDSPWSEHWGGGMNIFKTLNIYSI